uniref:Reverse transcriptase domain-containing protein n=1 Tax=Anolis carolinensis TaxID=28377 RepID=A0A803TS28_ANOCA
MNNNNNNHHHHHHHRRVWRKRRSESNLERVKAQRKTYCKAMAAVKKTYYSSRIEAAKNRPAELFRTVRGLLNNTPQTAPTDDVAEKCEAFSQFFSKKIALIRSELDATVDAISEDVARAPACPILMDSFQSVQPEDVDKVLGEARATTCILEPCPSWLVKEARGGLVEWVRVVVNASLREGRLPTGLKQAVIKPLLKKPSLDPTNWNNFRPVSNLPFLGKVLERVVASQLQGFLEATDYLDPAQSGFRPGHGTETALVSLVDDLRRQLDRGSVSLLVLLDLSAAFDTIDHGILLGRLMGMGLGGTALQWLQSFLEDRTQKVLIGDSCSAPQPLSCGVPQGSVLSPLLFNIYMKPLGEIIRSFGVRCHLYADDVQLYHSFSPASKEAVQILNRCLAAVSDWMRVNKLKLNPDKTEVLLVSRKAEQGIGLQPELDGVALPLKAQVRSLGVLLDSSLSLEPQVSAVARGAFAQLKLVRQLRPYLGKPDMATVVHALVTSRLDYCNALYVGLPSKTVRKLELVQRSAARLLTGAPYREHTTPLLKQLHWLPVSFWAQFKVLALAYKTLNGSGPTYLSERISPYEPPRRLRSSSEALLSVPPPSQVHLAGTRDRAFSVVAPRLWNSLPREIREAPSLMSFRKQLKTWMWDQAFGPS